AITTGATQRSTINSARVEVTAAAAVLFFAAAPAGRLTDDHRLPEKVANWPTRAVSLRSPVAPAPRPPAAAPARSLALDSSRGDRRCRLAASAPSDRTPPTAWVIDRALPAGGGDASNVAIGALHQQIQSEHLRLHGIVEQQLARREPHLERERVLDGDRERAIVGDPFAGVGGEVGGRTFERALVQTTCVDRDQQLARRALAEREENALVGEAGERARVEGAGVERVGDETLVHRRRAAHRVVP